MGEYFFDLSCHDVGTRVVHAAWDDDAINQLRPHNDALGFFTQREKEIETELLERGGDEVDRNLAHQLRNPVKLITSGPEARADKPWVLAGQERWEVRVPWWNNYADEAFVVFGHYSKTLGASVNGGAGGPLFPPDPYEIVSNTFSVDFAVGSRAKQRRDGGLDPASSLAAVRWPEGLVMHDDRRVQALKQDSNIPPTQKPSEGEAE